MSRNNSFFSLLLLFISSLALLISVSVECSTEREYWPTEGWRVSTPEEQGMSSERLMEMMEFIDENSYLVQGVVVIRNGYLVWEEYVDPIYDMNTTHLLFSVTKSFTSCLVGIALDDGYIEDVSQTMVSFFPDREIANMEGGKELVTVEDLLMMRAGMFWDESSAPYDSPENGIYHINREDGLQYSLDLPMVAEPGELWHYSTGASQILSGIVTAASGQTTLEFAMEHLFEPLGISNVVWAMDMGGTYKGGFDLQLTPRDMAKFGYLYLNDGVWDGLQVVSEEWVDVSTTTLTRLNEGQGYGYQWWIMLEEDIFHASGLYGQGIYVSRDEDIVFAVTASVTPSQHEAIHRLMTEYVMGAIIGEEPSEPQGQGSSTERGIPGFPALSVLLGLMLGVLALLRARTSSYVM